MTNPCVLSSAWHSHNGYAFIRTPLEIEGVHVLSYLYNVGDIPDGMTVDHLCRVRDCINPEHLELVTLAENHKRSPRYQVTHCPQGHEYTEENTYRWSGAPTQRKCKTCRASRTGWHYHSKGVQ